MPMPSENRMVPAVTSPYRSMRSTNADGLANGSERCSNTLYLLGKPRALFFILPVPEPEGKTLEFTPVFKVLFYMFGRDRFGIIPFVRDQFQRPRVNRDEIRSPHDQ